jgi:phosphate transport system permease protein
MSNAVWQTPEAVRRLAKRHAAERRFRLLGLSAIVLSLAFLALLLVIMLENGLGGLDWQFLTGSDSTNPDLAGVWGAAKGSMLTMLVTLVLSFPIGVLAAALP